MTHYVRDSYIILDRNKFLRPHTLVSRLMSQRKMEATKERKKNEPQERSIITAKDFITLVIDYKRTLDYRKSSKRCVLSCG
jgi:hypothetical protein